MPRGDGTGPEGKGPRTGRGLGYCPPGTGTQQQNSQGQVQPVVYGRGFFSGLRRFFGGGYGPGRGRRGRR